jgi:hypothetical protein
VSHFGSAAGGPDTVTLNRSGSSANLPVSMIRFPVAPCYTVSPNGSNLPAFADEQLPERSSYDSNCTGLPVVRGAWRFQQ